MGQEFDAVMRVPRDCTPHAVAWRTYYSVKSLSQQDFLPFSWQSWLAA